MSGGRVDADGLYRTIAEDMRRIPQESRRAVRPRLREAGKMIEEEAERRSSWSTRIPGTIRTSVSFRAEREEVVVIAGNAARAPHARPYEDVRQRGFFRHPVHPKSWKTRKGWTWVEQKSRPFLLPAAQAKGPQATTLLQGALDEVASELGFR